MRMNGEPRSLVLVAHPDDEMIGCGITLSRDPEALVVVVTDGGKGPDKARPELSREQLVTARRRESEGALAALGVSDVLFLDQEELTFSPRPVLDLLLHETLDGRLREPLRVSRIYGHLLNDEHPDHVKVGTLALFLALEWRVPLWQFSIALRHRPQRPPDLCLEPSEDERQRKRDGLLSYRTQVHVTRDYLDEPECFWRAV